MNRHLQTREAWHRLPVSAQPAIAIDNYVRVSRRLWQRFARRTGYVTMDIGGKPAPYKILEDMAWMKYTVNRR